MRIILLLIFFFSSILCQAQSKYQYVDPMPGSKNLNIEHNVIIRQGSILNAGSVKSRLFTISGSKSGRHDFTLKLCRDAKTILIQPLVPFAYDEQVTVSVKKGLENSSGEQLEGTSFQFNTHREYTAEEKRGFTEGRKILWDREMATWPHDSEEDNSGDTRDLTGLVTITKNTNPTEGDIFFDAFSAFFINSNWTGYHVITNDGDSVYSKELSSPSDFKMQHNGNFAVREGNENRFDVLDSNFNKIGNIYAANGYTADFHECQILADNSILIIADETEIVDMTVYNPNYSSHATVYGTVIQKFDPDGNLVFEWRSFDHVDVDEAQHIDLSFSFIDYIHTNSLEQDNDGNIIASNRHLDQVNKIDVNTGDFIWRLGGAKGDMTFVNDSDKFTWEHDARRIANGDLTLWDNGNYHNPAHSTAKEYQIDEVNKTATLVWSYGHPGGYNGYSIFNTAGGSVQRLSNGNTFINGGWRSSNSNPSMWEVTPDDSIVWEAKLTSTKSMTSYRAHRYLWTPCARPTFKKMNTKNITANSAKLKWTAVSGVYEYHIQYKKHDDVLWTEKTVTNSKTSKKINNLDPSTKYDWRAETWCDSAGIKVSGYTDIKKFTTLDYRNTITSNEEDAVVNIYPNPASDMVNIESGFNITELVVMDLTGRVLVEEVPNDTHLALSANRLAAGTYLVEIKGSDCRQVKKLVVE